MLGFGPKLNTVFQSRWKALFWSLGILVTAYCTVPSADEDNGQDIAKPVAAKPHKSPWAAAKPNKSPWDN